MNLWVYVLFVIVTQVFLVKPAKFFLHIHISVQINITVGRMVICSMEIKKLLVSKLWNHLRISTGLICIAVIREQGIQNNPIQNSLRWGKCSLHLIVYNSIVGKLAIFFIQLVAPALLTECLIMIVNIRIQNRIHIYMHQILKILIITACHRINSLIRIRHCI